jgi:hypothetical protein
MNEPRRKLEAGVFLCACQSLKPFQRISFGVPVKPCINKQPIGPPAKKKGSALGIKLGALTNIPVIYQVRAAG